MHRCLLVAAVLLLATAVAARAPVEVPRAVVASGGGTGSAPHHGATQTIGQAVAGSSSSARHHLWHGFWTPAPATGTAVPDDLPEPIPRVTTLHPNVPNPFNPRTTIAFDLSQPAADFQGSTRGTPPTEVAGHTVVGGVA